MAVTAYTYSRAADFPGGAVDTSNLWDEISASGSGITIQIEDIQSDPDEDDIDRLDIIFKDALPAGEKTALDNDTTAPAGGLIAAHDNIPTEQAQKFALASANSEDLTLPVLRTAPTIARPGFYRCDRDMKMNCGIYDAADSFEDIKLDVATNTKSSWGEITQVGIYKDVAGTMTLCDDQADADAEAILTVWDYQANIAGTPIEIEMLGGGLSVCPNLTEPVAGDKWKHQLYVVMAPGIPEGSGGRVKFFDGYLKPFEGERIDSINAMALALKPNPLAGNINTVIRIYIWYPKTSKDVHVLRLVTFRQLGTF